MAASFTRVGSTWTRACNGEGLWAVRPDGKEVWVANHVSDSVSVIDTDPVSASYRQVVETIQDLRSDGATLFDEPVGIAFASNAKAYVALSSRNQVAVVDALSYTVTKLLNIRAQDPRAIAVRNGRLYVAAFESGNQTEFPSCAALDPRGLSEGDAFDEGCQVPLRLLDGILDLTTFAIDVGVIIERGTRG